MKLAQWEANIRTARPRSLGAETLKRAELATMLRTSLIVATLASVSSPRPPATVFTVRSWGPSAAVRLRENPRKALFAGVVVVGDNGVVYQVRDDADDPAAALLDHPRHDSLRAIQGTPGRAKLLQVVVPSEVREISASDGIELEVGQCVFHQYVHQYIHGAKSVCRRADHLAHRRLVGDAGAVGEGFTPLFRMSRATSAAHLWLLR